MGRAGGAVPELDGGPHHPRDHGRGPRRARASASASRTSWPVVCEPFTQWVLEDRFAAGGPPLEDVGVQLVADVEPYELMKLRLLNASHQARRLLRLPERATGSCTRRAQDPLFATFLLGLHGRGGDADPEPGPGHRPRRVQARRSSSGSPTRRCATPSRGCAPRAPTASRSGSCRSSGTTSSTAAPSTLSAAIVASWARYAEGVDEQGEPIEVVDRLRDTVTAAAREQRDDPLAFLRNRELFGELAEDDRFAAAYLAVLDSLHRKGARATLQDLVS